MNENAVYVKTEAGEEAVTKRTIVQRNLRSILIMIDGHTPVGSLAQQFGDPLIVEGLVGELEHRGLVRRVDQSANDDADRAELSSMLVDIEDLVSQPITPVADDIRRAHERSSSTASPEIDEFARALPELSAPVAPAAAEQKTALPADDVKSAIRRAMLSSASSDAATDDAAGGRFRAWLGKLGAGATKPGTWRRRIVIGLCLIVAVLFATFFLYPYNSHLPQMEKMATELLGHPVRIASVKPVVYPEPALELQDVRIGADDGLRVGSVTLSPYLSSLFAERTELRRVHLDHVELKVAFLPALSSRRDINWASRWLKLDRLTLGNTALLLFDGSLGGFTGELAIDDNGVLTRLELSRTSGGVRVQGINQDGVWAVSVKAIDWETPGHPSVLADVFEASGHLNSQRLQFDKIEVKLYDGYVTGRAAFDLGRDAGLEGQMTASRLSLASVLKAFVPSFKSSGDLSATLAFSARGASFEALARDLRMEGNVDLQRGVLDRIDLVQAVRVPRAGGVRGGSTRFDRLEGDLVLTADGASLPRLAMDSGLVGAQGSARIAGGQLQGQLDVTVRGSATTVRAPVKVAGAYADPVVQLVR